MKNIWLLSMAFLLLISGCGSSQDNCANYCFQQDHSNCTAGGWEVLGTYPDCTCNFICPEGGVDTAEEQPAEIEEQPSCTDECDESGCMENKYYGCILQPDGCRDKTEPKMTKGKCEIECIFNSDCVGQGCIAHECKTGALSWDLKDLPSPFSDDAILVIGANAPASDVAAAMEVSAMLVYEGGKKFDTKLDNQVTEADYAHNLILIGSPCDNSIIEDVFGIACEGLSLTQNQAMLKLFDKSGKAVLLISGKTPAATVKAANHVANYGVYGFSGNEMIINA